VQVNLTVGDMIVTGVIGLVAALVASWLFANASLLSRFAADWWARQSKERAKSRAEKIELMLEEYRKDLADGHALIRRALRHIAMGVSAGLTSIVMAVLASITIDQIRTSVILASQSGVNGGLGSHLSRDEYVANFLMGIAFANWLWMTYSLSKGATYLQSEQKLYRMERSLAKMRARAGSP